MQEISGAQLVEWIESKTNTLLLNARADLREQIAHHLSTSLDGLNQFSAESLANQLAKSSDFKGNDSWNDFPELRKLLDENPDARDHLTLVLTELKREEHFKKTRVSYVRTVLRPFLRHWLLRMERDVPDLDITTLTNRSNLLQAMQIGSRQELELWAQQAYDLFQEFVVWNSQDSRRETLGQRPSGLVNPRSVRTYRQAWFQFFETHGEEILNAEHSSARARSNWNPESEVISFLNKAMPTNSFSQDVRPMRAQTFMRDHESNRANPTSRPDVSLEQDGYQVLIDLKASGKAGLEASRKWVTEESLSSSLPNWLKVFPEIWGEAGRQVTATVEIKDASGESKLELPSMPIEQLPSKIQIAINSLKH